jgi:hypothetical protein
VSPLSSTPAAAQVPAQTRPEIVVLCGSTRFRDRFDLANFDLTMDGAIVLAPGVWVRSSPAFSDLPDDLQVSGKVALDELHKRKIDLADRVYVINVATPEHPEGYIGESTRSEIAYAERLGKPIEYLVPLVPLLGTDSLLDAVDVQISGPYGEGNTRLIGRRAIGRILAAIRNAGAAPTDDDSRAAIARASGYPSAGPTSRRMVEMVAAALERVQAAQR